MDYQALGLKVGLEIHAQLDTEKLFCSCPTFLEDVHDYSYKRRLRPTMSELGEIDPAAKDEFTKRIMNIYRGSLDGTCLVYADEEPPHEPNRDAVYTLLQISALLGADIADEIQFMRKIVIDGSNVSGFQRTALVALNGKAFSKFGNVEIPTICLEEDAARLIEKVGRTKIWNVDRLGTPLVEIATDPSMHHPEQARDIALFLGQVMKSTGRLKRGIGTIRQDVNISIKEGRRVEIKGVQELNLIDNYVHNEVVRQRSLVEIRDELAKRGAEPPSPDFKDLSPIFEHTECKIIKGSVYGMRLPNFHGLLGMEIQEGRRLGTEVADYARKYVKGIFHSDELPAYGICQSEVYDVREALGVGEKDAFVLVAADKKTAFKALREVTRRANLAFEGVPNETRRPLPDGNTQYMRPLPGKSRMYPETDVYPISVTQGMMEDVMNNLPELPEERISRIQKENDISEENARKIVEWDIEELFVTSQKEYDMPLGRFLRMIETITMLSREGVEIDIANTELITSFMASQEKFPLESYEDILRYVCKNNSSVEDAIAGLGISRSSDEDVRAIIASIVKDNSGMVSAKGMDAFKPLMGKAMAELKGKSDGKTISAILKEELERAV